MQRTLRAYTDGSGGKSTSDKRFRTCGWGAVFMQNHFVPLIAFCGGLPGQMQTVPRAELAAAEFSVKLAALAPGLAGGDITLEIHIDCSLVCRGLDKGRSHCLASPTLASAWAPLWNAVAALEDQGLGCLRIAPIKVRAHADKTMAAFLQQAPHHTFGNMVADTLAGRGASFLHEVAVGPTFQAHAVDLRARLVMRRLVAITLQDVAANPRAKTKGLTAKAKREARLAERPRWLYQRRRRNGESGVDEGAARPPEAEPSDHEQLTLGELFGPEEDEFLAWGLFSPEPEEPRLADEPVVEAVSGQAPGLRPRRVVLARLHSCMACFCTVPG